MQHFQDLIKRFRSDERGVFMVLFAVLAIVLIATSGAVVDFTMVQQARTRAQTALDAATLALQKDMGTLTEDEIEAKATKILQERINDTTIESIVDTAIKDTNNARLTLQAHVTVPTYFVRLVGFQTLRANLETEVTRASSNLEVGLALDITLSMDGDPIDELKIAAKQLVNDLVLTTQVPTYSKMAIAPYSSSVNPGSYLNTVRGASEGGKGITSVTWAHASQRNLQIYSIAKSNSNASTPTKVTLSTIPSNPSLTAGDYIWINSSTGWSSSTWNLNGVFRIGPVTTANGRATFELRNANNANHNSYSFTGSYSGTAGRVTTCLVANCELLATTSSAHNMATNDDMFILTSPSGTGYVTSSTYKVANTSYAATGMTMWKVGATPTATTFVITGTDPRDLGTSSTNIQATGGTSYCAEYGCDYYRYEASNGTMNTYKVTNCVVERPTLTNAFTDTKPSTSPLGFQYANASGNYSASIGQMPACNAAKIVPLTATKKTLTDAIDALSVSGTTAGHLGLAWAWYMISPNFIDSTINVWPAESVPHPYLEKKLVKALILMTDGQFNTMYESGVPSEDSHSYSGTTAVRSTNDAPLGNSTEQALDLCANIRNASTGIELYTVGFMIGSNSAEDVAARKLLTDCAANSERDFFANSASELNGAFAEIARSLSDLRVSK